MAGGILGLQHSRFALFQDSVFPLSGRSLVRWSTCKSKPIPRVSGPETRVALTIKANFGTGAMGGTTSERGIAGQE
jgi:hypothetical protein